MDGFTVCVFVPPPDRVGNLRLFSVQFLPASESESRELSFPLFLINPDFQGGSGYGQLQSTLLLF